jgi:class 3 adenylate cyclase
MPRFVPSQNYHRVNLGPGKGNRPALSKKAFSEFDLPILGLGYIAAASKPTEAIAAVFDLEGFTNFCKQIEPHLSVPQFLYSFLTWLMKKLRKEMSEAEHGADVALWCRLPFFVKFLEDGLLVLWDRASMPPVSQRNVIVVCYQICSDYKTEFVATLRTAMVDPPTALRCGVARGTVFSVGVGHDYVGSCINMAARLQNFLASRSVLTGADLTSMIRGTWPFFRD